MYCLIGALWLKTIISQSIIQVPAAASPAERRQAGRAASPAGPSGRAAGPPRPGQTCAGRRPGRRW